MQIHSRRMLPYILMVSIAFIPGVLWGKGPTLKDPEKDLIRKTDRPENYETPIEDLNQEFTPSGKFFVRSHLPNAVETPESEWAIELKGDGFEKPVKLSLRQIKKEFDSVEINAVALCAGNRRAKFEPRVQGVQWDIGAVGNGRWRGVRLKDILARAGVRDGTVEFAFDGADYPSLPGTADFIKSIPLARAMDDSTILAYELNGKPLPRSNGYPLRLVVPGWVASYWMKQVISIEALKSPSDNYWMRKAYRLEKGKFPAVDQGFKSQDIGTTTPISELIVNSIITSVRDGDRVAPGKKLVLKGFAWDGGHGIEKVDVSVDGGASWFPASLGPDLGSFSWRSFTHSFVPARGQAYRVMAKATNRKGQTQPADVTHNPPGYHNNSIHGVQVQAN